MKQSMADKVYRALLAMAYTMCEEERTKARVYELADACGMTCAEALDVLSVHGVDVDSNLSTVLVGDMPTREGDNVVPHVRVSGDKAYVDGEYGVYAREMEDALPMEAERVCKTEEAGVRGYRSVSDTSVRTLECPCGFVTYRYQHGRKLYMDEGHRVQSHVVDCPFCHRKERVSEMISNTHTPVYRKGFVEEPDEEPNDDWCTQAVCLDMQLGLGWATDKRTLIPSVHGIEIIDRAIVNGYYVRSASVRKPYEAALEVIAGWEHSNVYKEYSRELHLMKGGLGWDEKPLQSQNITTGSKMWICPECGNTTFRKTRTFCGNHWDVTKAEGVTTKKRREVKMEAAGSFFSKPLSETFKNAMLEHLVAWRSGEETDKDRFVGLECSNSGKYISFGPKKTFDAEGKRTYQERKGEYIQGYVSLSALDRHIERANAKSGDVLEGEAWKLLKSMGHDAVAQIESTIQPLIESEQWSEVIVAINRMWRTPVQHFEEEVPDDVADVHAERVA